VRAAPAYSGRTGLPGFCEWGARAARAGVAGERRAPEARERESSREPRPDAEANVRRDGVGSPRASRGVSRGRLMGREVPVRAAPGNCRCGPHRPTRAAPAYWGSARGSPGRSSRRGWRAEGPGGPRARKLERAEAGCRGERPARRRGLGPSFARREPWSADGKGRNGAGRTGRTAGASRTGLLGPHRPTGVLREGARAGRAGVAGERRAPEARERESSREPRPDAEANVRRDGVGSPRAGLSRRAGHPGPAAYGAAGFLPAGPVAAQPADAGAGRTGLLSFARREPWSADANGRNGASRTGLLGA